MSILRIPSNQIDGMQRSPSKQSVLQYLQNLSNRRSNHDTNSNKEDFYSQEFRQLLPFFNISYYTLVTPFRIAKANDGIYKIETSVIQQICVAILNLVAVTILIREELNQVRGNIIQDPGLLFENVKAISRILAFIIGIYIFWTKKSKLKKLLKISQNGGNKEQIFRILITCLTLLFIGVWIADYGIATCYGWSKEVEENARDINKILNYGSNNNSTPLTFQTRILGSLYYCLKLYSYYIEELCELALLTLAFTVYRTCSGFHRQLTSKTQDLMKISLHYRYVRKITDLINEFVGPFLCVYILGFICYMLTSVIKLFKKESHPNQYETYFYYVYVAKNLAILIIAAEANRKMYYLKDWLFQFKMDEVHDRRIRARTVLPEIDNLGKEESYKILSWEAATTPIGLGSQFFTITHGFIAMLISIFVTYTIIQLEFNKDDSKTMLVTNKTTSGF